MAGPQMQGVRSIFDRRETPQKVFVYGTLKEGYGNHHYLRNCKKIGTGGLEGIMFHLGGFPAINLAEKFTRIIGEVYEVQWNDILNMDLLEGVNSNFYQRIETTVDPHGVCWTYVFSSERAAQETKLIPSGCWTGRDTQSVDWLGFGKGVAFGPFEAQPSTSLIKVGAGDKFHLIRSQMDNTYKMVDKITGEVVGSYSFLRDIVGTDGKRKPLLRLHPKTVVRAPPTAAMVPQIDVGPLQRMPIIYEPPGADLAAYVAEKLKTEPPLEPKPVEIKIPQAARLLGLKYGAA